MITLHTLPRYALFFIFSISFSILSAQLNVSPTASVTDGGTYPELDGARGITTVVIGEKTYALVAAFSDDGVQIIDISNPASPSAVASVTDGTTYPALNGARGITTVVIGEKTYALVAAYSDDGVQIIDISNPASPSAVASLTDGGTYPALNGARKISTVVIGEKTYALVAAYEDDGVQIMELVDPSFSAEEILANTVLLYPNPAKSQLQVEYTQPTQTQYTIYALTGQVVGQSHHREAHHTINVSHLSSGTYLLQAKSDKGEKYYHFIKE
jgi:hypothetical protein